MKRSELREQCFKMLFQAEFHEPDDLAEQIDLFLEGLPQAKEADQTYIRDKVLNVVAHLQEIDQQIDAVAEKWTTARMGKVELTILRLAYYEMKMDEDIPELVAINEAVELAKVYGPDEASSFVNGVLAKLV